MNLFGSHPYHLPPVRPQSAHAGAGNVHSDDALSLPGGQHPMGLCRPAATEALLSINV